MTPEDVANKEFTGTRIGRGYDETEVDDFLDEVEAELRRLLAENADLREQLARAQQGGGPNGATSTAVTQPVPQQSAADRVPQQGRQLPPAEAASGILALAQRTGDEYIAGARAEAERIVAEATGRATNLHREAEDARRRTLGTLDSDRHALEMRIEQLRAFEGEYRTRLRAYLQGQLQDLDATPSVAPGGNPAAAR